ncbi:ribosome recycling factor [Xylariaceae sp. FL0662B]|nr:ribosome recycling factor [Xylariaceae sp. FL0662B]
MSLTARTLLRQSRVYSKSGSVCYDVARPSGPGRPSFAAGSFNTTRPLLRHTSPTSLRIPNGVRTFHATLGAQKRVKSNKARTEEAADAGAGDNASKHPSEELFDFTDVESRLRKHAEHFQEGLKKLRNGGRFNPDVIGGLRVQPDRKSMETYPLREVAQVIPRGGRTISLLAHEEAYVKPIMSAIQGSPDFNQQPQRGPDNELELVLKIEPEGRDDLLKRVKAVCLEWRDRVRSIRQKRDKLHTVLRKDGRVPPDLKRTADKELEKLIKIYMTQIDNLEKEALKAAEAK